MLIKVDAIGMISIIAYDKIDIFVSYKDKSINFKKLKR